MVHVLNRAVARLTTFEKPDDYDALLRVLNETWAEIPLPILAFTAMPNHWHFVVRPTSDDQVSEFFRRLTVTLTMRWHAQYHTGGSGHLYQGRFKSFPVQDDQHLLTVMRYVERNALRTGLVEQAEDWRWGTLFLRSQRDVRRGSFSPAVTAVGSRESGASHSAGPPEQSDGRCWVPCCCRRRARKSSCQKLVAGDNLDRLSLWPVAHSDPTTSGGVETEDRGHAVTRAPPVGLLRR